MVLSLPLRLGARLVCLRGCGGSVGHHQPPLSHQMFNCIEGCVVLRNSLLPPSQKKKEPTNICLNGNLAPQFILIGAQKCATSSFAHEFIKGTNVVHLHML